VTRRFVFRVLVAALTTVSAAATIGQTPPPAPSTGQPPAAAQAPFRSASTSSS